MINCACVIHGDYYDFGYVDKLYQGICRNTKHDVTLHVYTEPDREVPKPYVKHSLKSLPASGPKKAWWFKTQLFDDSQFQGQMLYFDLDVVVVDTIDWIFKLDKEYLWGIRDFRWLWRPNKVETNSSVMYFNVTKYGYIWKNFEKNPVGIMKSMHGDQDFIHKTASENIRHFDQARIHSWKWELLDGGYDPSSRRHRSPGTGTKFKDKTSVVVFHGLPKLHDIDDELIKKYW